MEHPAMSYHGTNGATPPPAAIRVPRHPKRSDEPRNVEADCTLGSTWHGRLHSNHGAVCVVVREPYDDDDTPPRRRLDVRHNGRVTHTLVASFTTDYARDAVQPAAVASKVATVAAAPPSSSSWDSLRESTQAGRVHTPVITVNMDGASPEQVSNTVKNALKKLAGGVGPVTDVEAGQIRSSDGSGRAGSVSRVIVLRRSSRLADPTFYVRAGWPSVVPYTEWDAYLTAGEIAHFWPIVTRAASDRNDVLPPTVDAAATVPNFIAEYGKARQERVPTKARIPALSVETVAHVSRVAAGQWRAATSYVAGSVTHVVVDEWPHDRHKPAFKVRATAPSIVPIDGWYLVLSAEEIEYFWPVVAADASSPAADRIGPPTVDAKTALVNIAEEWAVHCGTKSTVEADGPAPPDSLPPAPRAAVAPGDTKVNDGVCHAILDHLRSHHGGAHVLDLASDVGGRTAAKLGRVLQGCDLLISRGEIHSRFDTASGTTRWHLGPAPQPKGAQADPPVVDHDAALLALLDSWTAGKIRSACDSATRDLATLFGVEGVKLTPAQVVRVLALRQWGTGWGSNGFVR